MVSLVIIVLVGLTSLGAYVIGTRRLQLSPRDLRLAGRSTLECVGLAVVFLALNVAIGIVAILAIRALTGEFVSVYVVNDVTIGLLSLLQGLTFRWWREAAINQSPRDRPRGVR